MTGLPGALLLCDLSHLQRSQGLTFRVFFSVCQRLCGAWFPGLPNHSLPQTLELLPEHPLAAPRLDELGLLCFIQIGILID